MELTVDPWLQIPPYARCLECNRARDVLLTLRMVTYCLTALLLYNLYWLVIMILWCWLIRGVHDPALWAGKVGNSWRTTDDINDSWARLVFNRVFCDLTQLITLMIIQCAIRC